MFVLILGIVFLLFVAQIQVAQDRKNDGSQGTNKAHQTHHAHTTQSTSKAHETHNPKVAGINRAGFHGLGQKVLPQKNVPFASLTSMLTSWEIQQKHKYTETGITHTRQSRKVSITDVVMMTKSNAFHHLSGP